MKRFKLVALCDHALSLIVASCGCCGFIDTVRTARVEYSLTVERSVQLCLWVVQWLDEVVSLYYETSKDNVFPQINQ